MTWKKDSQQFNDESDSEDGGVGPREYVYFTGVCKGVPVDVEEIWIEFEVQLSQGYIREYITFTSRER